MHSLFILCTVAGKVEEKVYMVHKIQGFPHHKDKFHCLTQAMEKEDFY